MMQNITHVMQGAGMLNSVVISGQNGGGYLNMVNQSAKPPAGSPGSVSLFNYGSTLTFKTDNIACSIASAATSDRVYTLPDLSDNIETTTSNAMLQNKTLMGGINGNTVSANYLLGVNLDNAVPLPGQLLQISSGVASWNSLNNMGGYTNYINMPLELTTANVGYVNATTSASNGQMIFPGRLASGSTNLTKVVFLAGADPGTAGLLGSNTVAGSMRIYDMTNQKTICEVNGMNILAQTLYPTTNILNLSNTMAVWQVQAKKTSAVNTNNFRATGCLLQFN